MSVKVINNKTVYHIKHPSQSLISNSVLFYIDDILSKTNTFYPRLVFSWNSKDSCELIEDGCIHHHRRAEEPKDKDEDSLRFQVSYAVIDDKSVQNIKFKHNENEIIFSIKKSGNPININEQVEYYQIIELIAENNQILDDFLKNAKTFFDDEIMENKKKSNLLNTYIWDDFWASSGKNRKRKLDTVYLPNNVVSNLLDDLNKFLDENTKKFYLEIGIPYKRIYMLEGPPGSGKTTLIKAIASELDYNINFLNFTDNLDDQSLMRALKKIKKSTLLVIEDVDCLFVNRKNSSDSKKKHRVSFSGLLNALDGISNIDNLIIFMTTNHINLLDEAFVRPGRVDYIITFDYADSDQIFKITKKFLPNLEDDFINRFIKKIGTKKVSMASLQQFLMKVKFSKNNKEDDLLNVKDLVFQKNLTHEVMYS